MAAHETPSAPRKITLGLIIGWTLGILLLLSAIPQLAKQPVTGLALLAASLVLLPPAIGFIQRKGNFHLSGGVKFLLVIILLGVAGTANRMQLPVTEQVERSPDAQPAAARAPDTAKSYQEVFTFKGNGTKKSEPFTITGSKFRITYDCKGQLCQAWLKSPDNPLKLDMLMNTVGSIKDENIFYGAGTYYIEANTLGTYSMVVEDYR